MWPMLGSAEFQRKAKVRLSLSIDTATRRAALTYVHEERRHE